MSLTNIEINLTNAGQHSATVTEVLGDVINSSSSIFETNATIGEKVNCGNSQVNQLLDDFLLESITRSTTPRLRKNELKLIDRYSEILERYALLVRGVSVSPFASLDFEGNVFPSSELPREDFANNFLYNIIQKNPTIGNLDNSVPIVSSNGFVVIGASYSVLTEDTFDEENEPATSFKVYNKETLQTPLSYGNTIRLRDVTTASAKYGYTAKDFFGVLNILGISVSDISQSSAAITEKKDVLFSGSGSLTNILSQVTSFYGYYWYVDLFSDIKGIKLISSTEASIKKVADPAILAQTDSSILSHSYTESGGVPNNILSFVGSTAPQNDKTNVETFASSPSVRFFARVRIEELLEDFYFPEFFDFFSSNQANAEESFNKFFFLAANRSKLDNYLNSIYYPFGLQKTPEGALIDDTKIRDEDKVRLKASIPSPVCYSILDSQRKYHPPSDSDLFTLLQGFYFLFDSLFISNRYSAKFGQRHTFSADNATISGPYTSDTKISEIDALQPFSDMLKVIQKVRPNITVDPTLKQLGEIADIRNLDKDVTDVQKSAYFVAIRPRFFNKGEVDERYTLLQESAEMFEGGELDTNYLVSTVGSIAWAAAAVDNSVNRFRQFLDKVNAKANRRLKVYKSRIQDNQSSEEGEGDQIPFDRKFFKVKTTGSAQKMSKATLQIYEGSLVETKLLEQTNLSSLGINTEKIVSSERTYAGLKLPISQDILTDSISISFGEDGTTTSISESNKVFLPLDQEFITTSNAVSKSKSNRFSAGARNYFGLN